MLTGWFALYYATIRVRNMHLFAYSAAVLQPVGHKPEIFLPY